MQRLMVLVHGLRAIDFWSFSIAVSWFEYLCLSGCGRKCLVQHCFALRAALFPIQVVGRFAHGYEWSIAEGRQGDGNGLIEWLNGRSLLCTLLHLLNGPIYGSLQGLVEAFLKVVWFYISMHALWRERSYQLINYLINRNHYCLWGSILPATMPSHCE